MNAHSDKVLLKPAINIERHWPYNLDSNDKTDFSEARSYTTVPCYGRWWRNVWVSSNSAVYSNGQVIAQTIPATESINYYRFRHLIKNILTTKKVRLTQGKKYLLITDNNAGGHFHWFYEVLPKLVLIADELKDFILLLPDHPYIHTIGIESLQMAGFQFEDIIFLQPTNFYKVPQLFYLADVATGGINDELMQPLQQRFLQTRQRGNRKIYISRQKAAYRKIVNEQELIDMLKASGFDILLGEDFNLKQQIDMFSEADTLVGIHGAGLTNCLFMHPGSRMVELRKKENNTSNVAYWLLADALQHKYYYFNGIPDSDRSLTGRGCNLTIDPHEFEKKVLSSIAIPEGKA